MMLRKFMVVMLTAMMTACASTSTPEALREAADRNAAEAAVKKPVPTFGTRIVEGPYIDRTPYPYKGDGLRNVTFTVSRAPIGPVIAKVAETAGLTVVYAGKADPNTNVDVAIRDESAIGAIRHLAQAAGYVAAVQDERRVIVSDRATFIFKIPTDAFRDTSSKYTVGGDGAGGTSSESGSNSGGGSSTGSSNSSMAANFVVSGGTGGRSEAAFEQNLRTLAGDNARVILNWSTGILSVNAPSAELSRVRLFIDQVVRDSLTQVQITAAILQVQLTDTMQFGVDWSRILDSGIGTINVSMNNASGVTAPAFSATVTGSSITSVLKALRQETEIYVISQPQAIAKNHMPATLFNGVKEPYLPSIQSTTANGGATSTGATLSYTMDGVSLSFVPTILNNELVSLKLIPVLSTVGDMRRFTTAGGDLQGPQITLRDAYLDVVVKDQQTIILGGNRSSSKANTNQGVPWLERIPLFGSLFKGINNVGKQDELVIMVSVRIIPPAQYEPLVSESI